MLRIISNSKLSIEDPINKGKGLARGENIVDEVEALQRGRTYISYALLIMYLRFEIILFLDLENFQMILAI